MWVCETDRTKYFVLNADGTVDFHNMCYKDVEYPEELRGGNPDGGKNATDMPQAEAQRQLAAFKCDPINTKQKWDFYAENYWGFQRQEVHFDLERINDSFQRLWMMSHMIVFEDGEPVLNMRMDYIWGDPYMFYVVRYKKAPEAAPAPTTAP